MPHALDRKSIDELAKFIKTGVPIDRCAAALGITPRTFYNYKRDAKAIINNEIRVRDFTEEYFDLIIYFIEKVFKAEAEAEIEAATTLKAAADRDWKAAAEWLDRRHPETWSKKKQVEHRHIFSLEGTDQRVDVKELSIAELEALAAGEDFIDGELIDEVSESGSEEDD